jgi:hypothetical protein
MSDRRQADIASLSTGLNIASECMIGRPVFWLWRSLLVGLAGLAFVRGAPAGQYNCEVPVAVLCQGCATDVSISLQARGGCRVSFTPASSAAAAQLAGAVSFRISTPSTPNAPAFRRRASYRTHVAASPQSSNGACFSFNGQQYCE